MVTLKRTQYAFGTLDASPAEWALIKTLLRYAESHYFSLELLYSIRGPEEQRRRKLQDLIEVMAEVCTGTPVEMHKNDLFLMFTCLRKLDGEEIPGVPEAEKDTLIDGLRELDVYHIFDDDQVTDADRDRWAEDS